MREGDNPKGEQRGPEAEQRRRRPRRSQQAILALILDSAGAEFQRSGYEGATTATIARAAGVTETQLFRYFRSKADLFKSAILEPLNERFERFNAERLQAAPIHADWRDAARAYMRDLIAFIEQHRDMFMSLIVAQRYTRASVDGVGAIDSLRAYFDLSSASVRRNLLPGDTTDPQIVVRVSFVAVLATVLFRDWLFPAGQNAPDAIAGTLVDFVMDGISLHHH